MKDTVSDQPLKGVRVLDFTWVWAGPLMSLGLADLGAEVIKVESSRRPDPFRTRGSERATDPLRLERSPVFLKLNRSKRSLGLDLSKPRGRELALDLAASSDLVLENFRAGTLERLGLGYPALRERNERVVLVSVCGGGQYGRWSNLKSFAMIASAFSGYEQRISYPGDEPIGGPTVAIGDPTGAAYGYLAAMAGLHRARRTGVGAHLDVSNIEAMVSIMSAAALRSQTAPPASPRPVRLGIACSGQDHWVALVLPDHASWLRLLELTGLHGNGVTDPLEHPDDAQATMGAQAMLETWSRDRTRDTVVAELRGHHIDAFSIVSLAEARSSAHSPGYYTLPHSVAGRHEVYGTPWQVGQPGGSAPLLGEHTDEILLSLGLEPAEIDELRRDRVVE
jgi:crotonobetainyl-CoA:carnitine CoA-transferase CaiB-like acyl-CoA transferase